MATTVRIPIDLRAPGTTIDAGNAFWIVDGLTAHDFGNWQFLQSADGSVFGVAHVPKNLAVVPAAKIVLILMANSTSGNVTSMQVFTAPVAPDGELFDPASLTSITVQDVTMPTTAFQTKEISFTIAAAPVADDLLIVRIFHDGNTANDTLAENTILIEAYLEIDVTQ